MATSSKGKREKSSTAAPSEEKYKQLKRKLKEVLDEHDHLSSKLKRARTKISQLKREKDLLLDRLEQYEHATSSDSNSDFSSSSDSDSSQSAASSGSASPEPPSQTKSIPSGMHTVFPPQVHVQLPLSSREVTPSKRQKKEGSKRAPVRTKLRKVQHVPLDEAGKPILPLQLGIITIYKLGEIVYDRRQFHSERYIYPVGYTVTRMYSSMIDPSKTVLYTCTITDGGDGPRFHVTPDDAPDRGVTASTATGAWTSIIRVANAIRQRDHSNSASGPDYFGFSHPTVAKLIQDLPNADKCESYVWQKFEEIKGRGTKRVNAKINKIPTLPSASPLAQSIGIPATPTNGQHYLLPSANYQPLPSNRIADMLSSPKGGSDVPDWSETGSAMMDDAKSTIYSRDTSPLIGPLGTSSVLSDDGLSGHGEDEDEDLMSDVAIGGIAVGPVDTGNESEGE